jgi:uncharacterized membrane protein YsdA (DUF1294 family)
MADQILTCVNCGRMFTWAARTQAYYASRSYVPPKRCPACLKKSKHWSAKPKVRFVGILGLAVAVPLLLVVSGYWLTAWVPVLWLLLINVIAFVQYGADKARAKVKGSVDTHTRTSENQLLGLVALGGTLGARRGRSYFRHKTQKAAFRLMFWVTVAVQLASAAASVSWLLV